MARKDYIANSVLALLIAITAWALWSVGDMRIDAYIALYTLEYVVVVALLRPHRIGTDWLLIILLAVFSIAVALRILEVLYS